MVQELKQIAQTLEKCKRWQELLDIDSQWLYKNGITIMFTSLGNTLVMAGHIEGAYKIPKEISIFISNGMVLSTPGRDIVPLKKTKGLIQVNVENVIYGEDLTSFYEFSTKEVCEHFTVWDKNVRFSDGLILQTKRISNARTKSK